MLHARLLSSPHPHATIKSVDLTAAKQLAGVKAAIVLKDPATPINTVWYQGEEIAAVAATTEEIAEDAIRLIKVEYEMLPVLATPEQAMSPNAPKVFEKGNTSAERLTEDPKGVDIDAALKSAAHVVEGLYSTQVQTHTSLETHGGVCEWDGDKLTAWVSTQAVHATKEGLAAALKIPQSDVHVITDYMGGGFGSKLGFDVQVAIAARLAKESGVPVKLMLTRKEEHLVTGNRPSAYAKVRAGVDAQGKFVAFDAETWGTGGAGQGAGFTVPYPMYVFPSRRQRHRDAYTTAGPQRAMRAPGHPQASFITEVVIDELADRLRMDPLELRLRNIPPPAADGQDPPTQQWRKYFPIAAQKIGWSGRHPTGDTASGPIKRGLGCAANTWAGGGVNRTRAICEILPDGGVVARIGTQDIGTGTRTLVAMIAAETMGLPLAAVKAEIGHSDYPYAPGSGGSVTVGSISPTLRVACSNALDLLFAKVAPTLGVEPAALAATGGRVHVKDTPAKGVSWKEACRLLGVQPISVEGAWQAGLSSRPHERRAVCRRRGGHRDRHHASEEDRVRAGLRDDRGQADGREPGIRRDHHGPRLRDVRAPHPRSQHRDDGEPEHGVLPPAGHVRHSRHRHHAGGSAGTRARRPRRTAGDFNGRRRGQRDRECYRGPRAQPAAHPGGGARGAPRGKGRRHAVKAFAYVNAANEKEAVAALGTDRGRMLPLAGGMDLLGLMKDFVAQPDRLVNVKNLDHGIVKTADGGLRIGSAVTLAELARARRRHARVSRAGACGGGGRDAADSQRGNRRGQPQSTPAMLVLPERRVRVPEEGGRALLRG